MPANDEDWIKALRFAALPGAERVEFSYTVTDEGASLRLSSIDAAGAAIGDDRDYDLLKAAMNPLQNLAEAEESAKFRQVLHLSDNRLERA